MPTDRIPANDNRNRIPAGEQTGFAAWRPPEVSGGQLVEVVHSGDHQPGGIGHSSIEDTTLDTAPASAISIEELERITQQAHDEGFAAGYEEGKQRGIKDGHHTGLTQGQQEIKQRLAQLQTALRNLMEPLRNQEQELEEAMFSMVITLAQSVLQRELKSDPQDILNTVHFALGTLPLGASNIRVLLAEQDADALKDNGLVADNWKLVGDKTMKPGDVRVQTLQSIVEFTVQERFSQCMEQMLNARLHSEPASDAIPDDGTGGVL
jgi:flagellar assembly protein FliH